MMLATITDMLVGLGALCLLVANAITFLWLLRRSCLLLVYIELHQEAIEDLYRSLTQLSERLTLIQKLHTVAGHTKPEAEPEPVREGKD